MEKTNHNSKTHVLSFRVPEATAKTVDRLASKASLNRSQWLERVFAEQIIKPEKSTPEKKIT